MTTAYDAFAKRLRHWRSTHNLSQAAFGELLRPKVHHTTVSCWENGVRHPSLKYLGQIVVITDIPADLALGLLSTSEETANGN